MCLLLPLASVVAGLRGGDDEIAAPGPQEPRFPAYDLSGEIEFGLRLLHVGGNERQYEEDLNLEEGPFLGRFVLRGTGTEHASPLSSFLLDAAGIGDPSSSLRLEARGGPWTTTGGFSRKVLVGNTDNDIHGFDMERELSTLSFEYAPEGGSSRASLELEHLRRDGTWVGSRGVGLDLVSGFPDRREESTHAARAALSTHFGELGARLELGASRGEATNRSRFSLPSTVFPTETWTEEMESSVESWSRSGAARFDLPVGEATLDLGLDWGGTDESGDLALEETGFFFPDPSLPFERQTLGDLDLSGREAELDVGARLPLNTSTELELRYTLAREEEDGVVARTVLLDELFGDPPSVFTSQDTLQHESLLHLFEAALDFEVTEWALLEVRGEWGREQIDIEEAGVEEGNDPVVIRFFDDEVSQFGTETNLSLDLTRGTTLDLSAGHTRRPTESTRVGVEYDFLSEETSFASVRYGWNADPRFTFSAEGRLELRESEAFESEGEVERLAFSLSAVPAEQLTANLAFVYQAQDLESDAIFLMPNPGGGVTPVPRLVRFKSKQRTLTTSLSWDLLPSLRPELSASGTISSGDAALDLLAAYLDVPYEFRHGLTLGARTQYRYFDGEGVLDGSDYDALVLELYMRAGF